MTVGSLGTIHFSQGFYLYMGSAMNGIEGRVKRHLSNRKKIHWHVDYLLNTAIIGTVFYREGKRGLECALAGKFEKKFLAIPGFGSSDCTCKGHLFFGEENEFVKSALNNKMKEMDL